MKAKQVAEVIVTPIVNTIFQVRILKVLSIAEILIVHSPTQIVILLLALIQVMGDLYDFNTKLTELFNDVFNVSGIIKFII